MRRIAFIFLFALSLFVFYTQLSSAFGELRVNEAKTKLLFNRESFQVSLALENTTGKTNKAQTRVEILDASNKTVAQAKQDANIQAGESSLIIPIELPKEDGTAPNAFFWYRLHYKIETNDSQTFEGIISFSEITPDFFTIQATGFDLVYKGLHYQVHVRAFHPFTKKGFANVQIFGEIKLAKEEEDSPSQTLKSSAMTDANGYATLSFTFPTDFNFDDADIKITGRRGQFTQILTENVHTDTASYCFIQTDKPIYQPAQTLHIRALVRDGMMNNFLPDTEGTLTITDPEDTLLFRAPIKTSRMGIASVDWKIPDNVRLGEYRIKVDLENIEGEGHRYFTISRYELPNFTVNAKPDKSYYWQNQNARVEVSADYLFGQPVVNGNVRVVRETEREWNYREQKWETEEDEIYEGKTDASGKFTAKIDLKKKHEELKENNYSRFKDVNYVAYFTDSTTNRTESRRFDLRVTKQPIHVYLVNDIYNSSSKFPLQLYVSAFYADGKPAVCNLEISEVTSDDDDAKFIRALQTLRTNRFGIAKVNIPSGEDEIHLRLTARDAQKRVGFTTENINFHDYPAIRVSTNKTIYRKGEPVKVEIVSSEKTGTVQLDVGNSVIESYYSTRLQLDNGRAFITIPYKAEFKGTLTINAYSNFGKEDFYASERIIIYPNPNELQITAVANSNTYRPGEDAKFDFSILTPNGKPVETVLGVVVFDKAVSERERTDKPGHYNNGFLSGWMLAPDDASLGVVRRRDVDYLDLTKPVPRDYELAVEAMLNQSDRGFVQEIGDEYDDDYYRQDKIFGAIIKQRLSTSESALTNNYRTSGEYPRNEISLKSILDKNSINIDSLRDPWGMAYHAEFSVEEKEDVLTLVSSGADKKFKTDDDFTALRLGWNYFKALGLKIDSLVIAYHKRTGGYIRDKETFLRELQTAGIDSNLLIDRWGVPYYFDFLVDKNMYAIAINSSGEDKKRYAPHVDSSSDDFVLWKSSINYFEEIRETIFKTLDKEFRETKSLPQSEKDFHKLMSKRGIDFDSLRDGWGNKYHVSFTTESRYADSTTTRTVKQDDGKTIQRTEIIPVTQEVAHIHIRSAGEDQRPWTYDDFDAATFSNVISETRRTIDKNNDFPQNTSPIYQTILSPDKGAISGRVLDWNGAVVAGATVIVKTTNFEKTTTTNDDGLFIINECPPGVYEIKTEASGFKAAILTSVEVKAGNEIQISIELSLGTPSESVNVVGGAPEVATSSNQVPINELSINGRRFQNFAVLQPRSRYATEFGKNITIVTKSGTSTPRLREYFPETLFWQPEVITDAQGRARIIFKLADNITTWNLAVVGTTLDGQIGTAQTEIRAFQPFFVEHDPPKNLTVGDEISLPVVVRNYTARKQLIDVAMKGENWFSLLSSSNQKTSIAAGNSGKALFPFRANVFGKNLKQRVTAQGIDANDAIERAVDVSPDGQQIFNTTADIFTDSVSLETNIPNTALSAPTETTLKIYPNLMAHVFESVEAIMSRPYGCAEQTISAAYPGVLVLKAQKRGDKIPDDVIAKANKYVRQGYERLIGYKTEDGGFTYWGRGNGDAALTAYALHFLIEAKDVIDIDENVTEEARQWLIKNQNKDGSWTTTIFDSEYARRQQLLTTAFIARVLASSAKVEYKDEKAKEKTDVLNARIKRALSFLRPKAEEFDEPYLIASYALAAVAANEKDEASRTALRLEKLARNEGAGSYWSLETNTPFYGWGQAGRIETTALALQALANVSALPTGGSSRDALIKRGLLFLLKQKDGYGVWHSTQATINVLDALVMFLQNEKSESSKRAEIFVDGKLATTIELTESPAQVSVDLSKFISGGKHRVEIRRDGKSPSSAQLVTSYYLPWQKSAPQTSSTSDLRFNVDYDKTNANVSDEITVRVEAERIGLRGHGMLLAEIGLPPGADVDRATLDKAVTESGWAFSYYDVLPDRIVAYLWPTAGGVKFNFKFKPRYGIKAQTAVSQLYDYYNPEARIMIAPTKFVIK